MRFEWDEDKAASNFRKHRVAFKDAVTVFDDPLYIDFYDPDHSTGEHRFLILGQTTAGRLLLVSYAEREDCIRLISARHATPRERRTYENT